MLVLTPPENKTPTQTFKYIHERMINGASYSMKGKEMNEGRYLLPDRRFHLTVNVVSFNNDSK